MSDDGQMSSPPPTDGGEPASGDEPQQHTVRYTRRRFLALGGAFVAGVAAVVTGLRFLGGSSPGSGGSSSGSGGGSSTDLASSFPALSVEGPPDVPADQWVVEIDGLVDTPLKLDRPSWDALTHVTETADFHCVEGWGVDDLRWGGVRPAVVLDRAGVRSEATYAVFHAAHGTYFSSLPLELVGAAETLLADTLDGRPLPSEHGGPLRLVVPAQLGYKNVKWVSRIELTDHPVAGYWESRGYPQDAPVPGT